LLNRRLNALKKLAVALPGLCLLVCAGCSSENPPAEKREARSQPLPRPAWLHKEPLIIVGNWDSMPIFRRRAGGGPVWQEEDYLKEHTEETVLKLKDLGVTMAVIHFYKGFGLEAEKEHLEQSRKLASLCKKHGLRVGVYVGSTIAHETFLLEKPEAETWFVPRFLGKPVFYGTQTFRKRVYFMHPGYREYMKRVLKLAVEDLKADLIHFDNTSLQAQPEVFLHPQAVQDFREFLRNKYPPEVLKKRLGFSGVKYVEPPEYDRPLTAINDPLFQEWTDFRCRQLASYYGEMESYIRGLNPEVAVECNPHLGISGRNTAWDQGVDYPRLLAHMDVVWTEERNPARVTGDGILVSKIRTYKMATILKNKIFTYTGGTERGKLEMAEAMAYNRQTLGMVGGVLLPDRYPEDQRAYIKFFLTNFGNYRGVDNLADVAVLHSFASMAYNNDLPWQSAMLFEQALIQGRVPFDIIFDQHLNDLSKYRVLVLPDQECLSDEQGRLIREYVNRGGGLVATEDSSLYTEWRQRRREFGLRDLFQIDPPGGRGREAAARRNEVAQGRVVYIPSVRPALPKRPAAPMTSEFWKLPVNWEELLSAVRWAARDDLSLVVKAPLTVTAELQEQKGTGKLLVHLINYDVDRKPQAGKIEVSLRIPRGKKAGQVTVLSPDEAKPQSVVCALKNDRAVFTVPGLKTYSVAVLQLR